MSTFFNPSQTDLYYYDDLTYNDDPKYPNNRGKNFSDQKFYAHIRYCLNSAKLYLI